MISVFVAIAVNLVLGDPPPALPVREGVFEGVKGHG